MSTVTFKRKPKSVPKAQDSSNLQNVGNIQDCYPSRFYEMTLKFTSFRVKLSVPDFKDADRWRISFFPPKILQPDDRDDEASSGICVLKTKFGIGVPVQDTEKDSVFCTYYFEEDQNINWRLEMSEVTEEILQTSLRVLLHTKGSKSVRWYKKAPIGYCDLPFGSIFSAKAKIEDGYSRIDGRGRIYRSGNSTVTSFKQKIGYLEYEFVLNELKSK